MSSFVFRPDGLRSRNAAAPGAISLRSMAPAKAAYAATGNFFYDDGGWKVPLGTRYWMKFQNHLITINFCVVRKSSVLYEHR